MTRRTGCIRMKYSLTASSHTGKYTAPPYLHLALGHRWPWDQVGGARVGRGTVALRCLGCLPTITSSISGVRDAQRSRRHLGGLYITSPYSKVYRIWLYSIRIQPARIVPARLSGYTAYTAHTAHTAIHSHTAIHAIHHTALYSLPLPPTVRDRK